MGLATVTVEGTGAYEGSKELTYRIGFKDIAKGSWYYNVVYRANDLDLVGGYSGDKTGTFGPNDNITRGDVAVILWRMASENITVALQATLKDDAKESSAIGMVA